jgi:hypothetical protein
MAASASTREIIQKAEEGDILWLSKSANATNDDLRLTLKIRRVNYLSKDTKTQLIDRLMESVSGRRSIEGSSSVSSRCPYSPNSSRKYGFIDEFWDEDCTQYYYREGDEGYGTCAKCVRASSPSKLVRCPSSLIQQRNRQGADLQNGRDYTFIPYCSSDLLAEDGSSDELPTIAKLGLAVIVPGTAPYYIAKALTAPSSKRERPDDGRCEAITKKGERCKNKEKYDGFCGIHSK